MSQSRNAINWENKFQLNVWYVIRWSLWLDFKILFSTAFKVCRQEGRSQNGYGTRHEFSGKN
ncbi:sugar transferase [Microcoleus sp. ARI1-B5]|uniref:sugar transferase n=1 Tax=Microcoleus sp. ARI1-A1 TaxID=2818556 RepID=UPI002FD251C6